MRPGSSFFQSVRPTQSNCTKYPPEGLIPSKKKARDRSPPDPDVPMPRVILLLLCLCLGVCSSVSEAASPEPSPQPDAANLSVGIRAAISNSHFLPPIEVTDLFRAPAVSSNSWMVCIRGTPPVGPQGWTYSAFFKDTYVELALFSG